jgi:hypothetical protein
MGENQELLTTPKERDLFGDVGVDRKVMGI